MAGEETERREPSELDLLVEKTAQLFRDHSPVLTPKTGEPYILPHAAREAVKGLVDSGRRPEELVLSLASQTRVPPGAITQWTDFSGHDGNWPDFFTELSVGILREETGRRHRDLARISNERAEDERAWQAEMTHIEQ